MATKWGRCFTVGEMDFDICTKFLCNLCLISLSSSRVLLICRNHSITMHWISSHEAQINHCELKIIFGFKVGYKFLPFISSLSTCKRDSIHEQNAKPAKKSLDLGGWNTGSFPSVWGLRVRTNVYLHNYLNHAYQNLPWLVVLSSTAIRAVCQQNKRFSVKRALNEAVNCSVWVISSTDAPEI